jgi:hypothetical protein
MKNSFSLLKSPFSSRSVCKSKIKHRVSHLKHGKASRVESLVRRRSSKKSVFISIPKEDKNFFGRLLNEVRRNSADKATAFHRSSLREKALPKNACRLKAVSISVEKISVLSVSSVAKKIRAD